MICSPFSFDQELENIHNVVTMDIILMSLKAFKFFKEPVIFTPSSYPVRLKLLWLGGKIQTLADCVGFYFCPPPGYVLSFGLIRVFFLIC